MVGTDCLASSLQRCKEVLAQGKAYGSTCSSTKDISSLGKSSAVHSTIHIIKPCDAYEQRGATYKSDLAML